MTDSGGENSSMKRTTLTGVWVLDKSRGNVSMRGYLETMGVTELAIEAHEKGEADHDTIHTITLDNQKLQIVKHSRVNRNIKVDLEWGKELEVKLPPGDRIKKSLAVSENPQHFEIKSSLNTMNGMAHITDVRRLTQESDKSVMVQELVIFNERTNNRHVTTRYFNPYTGIAPHLVADANTMQQG